jgi:arginyl-tRNA synthetase
VLDFAGFEVTREYYINDAGRQMDILAVHLAALPRSLRHRHSFPPNAYQGDYVKDMAAQIKDGHGDRFARVTAVDVVAGAPSVETDKEAHLDA